MGRARQARRDSGLRCSAPSACMFCREGGLPVLAEAAASALASDQGTGPHRALRAAVEVRWPVFLGCQALSLLPGGRRQKTRKALAILAGAGMKAASMPVPPGAVGAHRRTLHWPGDGMLSAAVSWRREPGAAGQQGGGLARGSMAGGACGVDGGEGRCCWGGRGPGEADGGAQGEACAPTEDAWLFPESTEEPPKVLGAGRMWLCRVHSSEGCVWGGEIKGKEA